MLDAPGLVRSVDLVSGLSPRESEVLAMTARGLTNREVAQEMSVTVHAVKFHLAAVYRKLGVSNRTEAAIVYLEAARATIAAGGAD